MKNIALLFVLVIGTVLAESCEDEVHLHPIKDASMFELSLRQVMIMTERKDTLLYSNDVVMIWWSMFGDFQHVQFVLTEPSGYVVSIRTRNNGTKSEHGYDNYMQFKYPITSENRFIADFYDMKIQVILGCSKMCENQQQGLNRCKVRKRYTLEHPPVTNTEFYADSKNGTIFAKHINHHKVLSLTFYDGKSVDGDKESKDWKSLSIQDILKDENTLPCIAIFLSVVLCIPLLLICMFVSERRRQDATRRVIINFREAEGRNIPARVQINIEPAIVVRPRLRAVAVIPPKKIIVESIIMKYREGMFSESERTCSICYEEYSAGNSITVLSCTHSFCSNCFDEWKKIHRTCPVCRAEVRK